MRFLSIFFSLLLSGGCSGRFHSIEPSTRTPKLYERTDFTVLLTADYRNAYLQEEVALDMLIETPSGEERLLPCFWVEGKSGAESRWEARFTPQEPGRYFCRFRLSEQGEEVARSRAVELSVQPAAEGERGILHVRDNWTLVYDDGTPFRGVAENICWESRANDDSKFSRSCTSSTTVTTTTACCRFSPKRRQFHPRMDVFVQFPDRSARPF